MAITFDAATAGEASANWQSSWSFSHTVASGSNRILVVMVSIWQGGETVTGVTYNGVSMTKSSSRETRTWKTYIFTLVNPATGSNTVAITCSGAVEGAGFGAVSYQGVDQSSPIGSTNSATGDSTTASLTLSSATDRLALVALVANGGTRTPGASQTSRLDVYVDVANMSGALSSKAGSSSTSLSYTVESQWALAALDLKPASTTTTKTQSALARIRKTVTQTIQARARIRLTVQKTQVAIARLRKTVQSTTTARARIRKTQTATILARAKIWVVFPGQYEANSQAAAGLATPKVGSATTRRSKLSTPNIEP